MFHFKLVRPWLGLLLLLGCWYMAATVSAQGLVGAPVDPRGGVDGGISKDAYNFVVLAVGIAAGVSLVLVGVFACHRAKKVSAKRLVLELMLVGLIPLVIYIGGIFSANSLAHLGSLPIDRSIAYSIACPIGNPIVDTIAMQINMLVAGCHHV